MTEGQARATPLQGTLPEQVAALAAAGADRFDAVRFRYIEAMVARAGRQRAPVARLLEARVEQALQRYRADFAAAQAQAAGLAGQLQARYPATSGEIHRLYEAGAFGALAALGRRLERGGASDALTGLRERLRPQPADASDEGLRFEDLLHHQEAVLTGTAPRGGGAQEGTPAADCSGELRAMRRCRESALKRGAERRVAQAREHCPQDSGPLNACRLATRSLAIMREVSPQYLHRFVAYFDTLLWLEQADAQSQAALPRKAAGRAPRAR